MDYTVRSSLQCIPLPGVCSSTLHFAIPRISQRPGAPETCTQSSFPQPQGNWWEAGTEPGLLSGSLKQRGHNSSFLESKHWNSTCALLPVPEEGITDRLSNPWDMNRGYPGGPLVRSSAPRGGCWHSEDTGARELREAIAEGQLASGCFLSGSFHKGY